MMKRLRKNLVESPFSPINVTYYYEKVYTKIHLGSKAPLLSLLVAWELSKSYYKLADPFCSLIMKDHEKVSAFEFN